MNANKPIRSVALCLRVLVASALAGISAEMVQADFGGGRHFLCAGSYRFCYWLSMTKTPNTLAADL
jgi:hypothetical protein